MLALVQGLEQARAPRLLLDKASEPRDARDVCVTTRPGLEHVVGGALEVPPVLHGLDGLAEPGESRMARLDRQGGLGDLSAVGIVQGELDIRHRAPVGGPSKIGRAPTSMPGLSWRHPGLTRSQRRNGRRAGTRAARREAGYEPYYTAGRPATAKTFRESVGVFRRIQLLSLDMREDFEDMRIMLNCLTRMNGGPQIPEYKPHKLDLLAQRHWVRPVLREWRGATLAARLGRRLLARCFGAWAWHPDGALLGGLAAKHAGSFAIPRE